MDSKARTLAKHYEATRLDAEKQIAESEALIRHHEERIRTLRLTAQDALAKEHEYLAQITD